MIFNEAHFRIARHKQRVFSLVAANFSSCSRHPLRGSNSQTHTHSLLAHTYKRAHKCWSHIGSPHTSSHLLRTVYYACRSRVRVYVCVRAHGEIGRHPSLVRSKNGSTPSCDATLLCASYIYRNERTYVNVSTHRYIHIHTVEVGG